MFSEEITFQITKNLVSMLSGVSGDRQKEVWSKLAEAAQVCVDRMNDKNISESWRWFNYPKTTIRMKVKLRRRSYNGKITYHAFIKLDTNELEGFSSAEVRDFLIEEVLLGE